MFDFDIVIGIVVDLVIALVIVLALDVAPAFMCLLFFLRVD